MCRKHQKLLKRIPSVVGEWSLALGNEAAKGEEAALQAFAKAQLDSYSSASHGWFFWNWKDSPQCDAWDFSKCVKSGWVSSTQWVTVPPSPSGSESSKSDGSPGLDPLIRSASEEKKRKREPSEERPDKQLRAEGSTMEPSAEAGSLSSMELLYSQLVAMGFAPDMVGNALMHCASLPAAEKFEVTLNLLTAAAIEPVSVEPLPVEPSGSLRALTVP